MVVNAECLELRPVLLSDAVRIHEWASKPEACRFQVWGPNTEDETRAFVSAAVEAWSQRPQYRWVWSVVDSDQLVVGMGEIKLHSQGCAEIAYAVHVDLWGQGLGTAIGRMLTRWIFDAFPAVDRVQATCDPRNIGSEKILRRIGMSYEGTLRHTMRIRDGWRDSKMFSILRAEWNDSRASTLS